MADGETYMAGTDRSGRGVSCAHGSHQCQRQTVGLVATCGLTVAAERNKSPYKLTQYGNPHLMKKCVAEFGGSGTSTALLVEGTSV